VSMWECEWNNIVDENEQVREFLDAFYDSPRPRERLKIRDGLRGGRVEPFRLLYHAKQNVGRSLFYIDQNSLVKNISTLIYNSFFCF
jgi:hypothetical protein